MPSPVLANALGTSHFSASCQGHFGELLQGMFEDGTGHWTRGLVTLPCRELKSRAELILRSDLHAPLLLNKDKPKVAAITALYCTLYNLHAGCSLEIISNIPVGVGMGSSTADLVATVRVLDKAYNFATDSTTLLQLILQVEKACDPTMFSGNALLFAQREGRVLERFASPLPPFFVHGFDLMPGESFITDEIPPADYDNADLLEFAELRNRLRQALLQQNLIEIARVSTQSAVINQRYFPKARFDELLALQKESGALGICVAHSGTMGGLIFSDDLHSKQRTSAEFYAHIHPSDDSEAYPATEA